MKYLYLLLLLNVVAFQGYTEEAVKTFSYKCYSIRNCDHKIEVLDDYVLVKDSILYFPSKELQEVTLPDTGIYILMHSDPPLEQDSMAITIKDNYKIDTFQITSLLETAYLDGPTPKGMANPGWEYCDKPANGHIVDYYANGNKKVEGDFKKGLPVGTVKYYRNDGKLSSIRKYNKRGELIKNHYYFK